MTKYFVLLLSCLAFCSTMDASSFSIHVRPRPAPVYYAQPIYARPACPHHCPCYPQPVVVMPYGYAAPIAYPAPVMIIERPAPVASFGWHWHFRR
jgi:hypothetical protein